MIERQEVKSLHGISISFTSFFYLILYENLLFIVSFLISVSLFSQNEWELEQAVNAKKVSVQVKGFGGYHGKCIRLGLKNLDKIPLLIRVDAGRVFVSDDTTVQDLILTKEERISIAPGELKYTALNTMCTQSHNAAPRRSESFNIGKMAEEGLLKIATFLSKNNYQSSTAQSAVWAVADKKGMENVYGTNTAEVKGLVALMSEVLSIPLSSFKVEVKEHHITDISTSVEWRTDKPLTAATLEVYDEKGNLMKTYFQNKKYKAGFHQWKFGFFHTDYDSTKQFFVRLREGNEVIEQRWVAPEDSILGMQLYDSQIDTRFQANTDITVDVNIYDEKGNLYMAIAQDVLCPKGYHNKRYLIHEELPKEHHYTLKITDKSGNLISEQALDAEKKAAPVYPVARISKLFKYTIKEDMRGVSLVIVNEAEEVRMVVFQNGVLHPGDKVQSYTLVHKDGPDAKFRIRLLNAAGEIIKEEKVN